MALYTSTVSMHGQQEQRRTFSNYPYALYGLDVKFQPAYRPSGQFGEQRRYYSGKHKLYGYKIECAAVKPGVEIHVSSHYTGSASDLTICLDNADKHRSLLAKTKEERQHADYGEGSNGFSGMWSFWSKRDTEGFRPSCVGSSPPGSQVVATLRGTTSCGTGACHLTAF